MVEQKQQMVIIKYILLHDGNFIVNSVTPINNKVDYLVIAGGGAGGAHGDSGAGGGAGGFRESYCHQYQVHILLNL